MSRSRIACGHIAVRGSSPRARYCTPTKRGRWRKPLRRMGGRVESASGGTPPPHQPSSQTEVSFHDRSKGRVPRFLTMNQAAKYLEDKGLMSCTAQTVKYLSYEAKQLPRPVVLGRKAHWRRTDLDALIESL